MRDVSSQCGGGAIGKWRRDNTIGRMRGRQIGTLLAERNLSTSRKENRQWQRNRRTSANSKRNRPIGRGEIKAVDGAIVARRKTASAIVQFVTDCEQINTPERSSAIAPMVRYLQRVLMAVKAVFRLGDARTPIGCVPRGVDRLRSAWRDGVTQSIALLGPYVSFICRCSLLHAQSGDCARTKLIDCVPRGGTV